MRYPFLRVGAIGTALGLATLAQAGDAVKLDVKLGLWEVTTSGKTGGQLPEELLRGVPPERRQQLVASMQASMARPKTHQHCLTAANLSKGFDADEHQASCQKKVDSNTSSSMSMTSTCTNAEGTEVVKANFKAVDRENVIGTINVVMSRGGQTMTVDNDFRAKWVGASCGNVKD